MARRISKRDAARVFRQLAAAARPFGPRVERTPHSLLPDLVFVRPSDGLNAARLRYFELADGSCRLQTVIHHTVSPGEQREIEQHLADNVVPVILRVFSRVLWLRLPDVPPPTKPL